MTGQDYRMIARLIRKLPGERLIVAEHLAAMFAKEDPDPNRNRLLAAALWGIERRAHRAVVWPHSRSQTRRAPTPAVAVRIELGH